MTDAPDFGPDVPGCTGKVGFASPQLANKVLKRRKWDRARADLSSYRCPHCGLWHHGGRADKKRPWKGKRR